MVCRLAARFGGTPLDWAAHPEIYLDTMTALANEQDRQHQQSQGG